MDVLKTVIANKRVRAVLFVVFILLFLLLMINLLTKGSVVITSKNKDTTITLSKIGDSNKNAEIKSSQGKLTARLKPGRYTAVAHNKVFSSSQVVEVKSRKTTKYELTPAEPSTPATVLPWGARNIIADSSSFVYVDMNSRRLSRLGVDGRFTVINPDVSFASIEWVDTSFGVGKGDDGHLYKVSSNNVSPLLVPFSYEEDIESGYSVSANGQVYLSHGSDIYASTNGVDKYTKIFTSKSSKPSLIAGVGRVTVLGKTDAGDAGSSSSSITFVDNNGSNTSSNTEIYNGAWSKDGKYFAVTSDSTGIIFDSSLEPVANFPSDNVIGLVWLDNTTLLYGVEDQLWSFDVGSGKASMIANMPFKGAVSQISPGVGGDFLYVTAEKNTSSDEFLVYKIGLKGQKPDASILQLGAYLPKDLENCYLTFTNFLKPVLIIKGSQEVATLCQSQVAQELAQDELNNYGLPSVFYPVNDD